MIGFMQQMAASAYNNGLAIRREDIARMENYRYNEMAANESDKRTRALYNDLYSPKAQVQQLIDAGLSPSVFYGNAGGIVGQSGANGGGGGNIQPTIYGIDPNSAADIELKLAQARNLDADTKTKEGRRDADIANIMADTAKKYAEMGAIYASKKLTEAQTTMQELQNYIHNATKDFDIEQAQYMLEKVMHDAEYAETLARKGKVDAIVSEETEDEQKEIIRQQLAQLKAETLAKYSNISLNEKQIEMLTQSIVKMERDVEIAQQNADTSKVDAETRQKQVQNAYELGLKDVELRAKELGLKFDDYALKYITTNKDWTRQRRSETQKALKRIEKHFDK